MGHLTDDMTRLSSEIGTLHRDRQTFLHNLQAGVSAMREEFCTAHAKMAKRTRGERRAFVSAIRRFVADLLTGFADDIQGAHRAWAGTSFASAGTTGAVLGRPDKKHNFRKTR